MSSARTSTFLALAIGAAVSLGAAGAARAGQAVRASDFLRSLGVNTHLNYTDGMYSDYESVIADLNYLGIHRLRDAAPDPYGGIPYQNYMTALDAAAGAGNTFDFIANPQLPIGVTLDQIGAVERLHPGSVAAIEGPNETNNSPVIYRGLHGRAAALSYQRDLYRAVHGFHLLHGVAVYYYTGNDVAASLAGLADFANCHPYSYQGDQPARRIGAAFGQAYTMAPPYPRVVTEAGYFDVPTAPNGVDDKTQAKNTLNLYLDGFAEGVSVTYVYQLVSAYDDQGSDTQSGMFRRDHTPKPVATALHNLTTILADGGGTAAEPASLDFSVAAMPATGHALLLEKSSGLFDIVLWAEPADWNDAAHRPIAVPPTPVTVTLSGTAGNVRVYDPLVGTKPIKTAERVTSLAVGLTDHPLIIEVRPTRDVMTAERNAAAGDRAAN